MKFLPFIFISFLTIRDILASFVKIPVVILHNSSLCLTPLHLALSIYAS